MEADLDSYSSGTSSRNTAYTAVADARRSRSGRLEFSNACLWYIFNVARRIPVLKRLYPALQKLWAKMVWTGGVKIKRYRGVLFLVDYRNFIDRCIGLRGNYLQGVSEYLFSEMERTGCDIFIDAGASVGVFSLQAAHRALAGDIYAFEPDPRSFAQLTANVYLNKFTHLVRVRRIALSDAKGTVHFELAPAAKATISQVYDAQKEAEYAVGHLTSGTGLRCEIEAARLDDLVSCCRKKVYIKMSIQGHELKALQGSERILRENECFLQIMIWPENRDQVIQYCAAAGYGISHIRGDYYYLMRDAKMKAG